MTKILDKNSVDYLRSDIEHNQLFGANQGPIKILDPAFLLPDANPDFALKFHTTGNGIVYLSGRAIVQQAITAGTNLLELPGRLSTSINMSIACSIFSSPNFSFLALVIVENVLSAAQDFGALNDIILFEPAFYLQGK